MISRICGDSCDLDLRYKVIATFDDTWPDYLVYKLTGRSGVHTDILVTEEGQKLSLGLNLVGALYINPEGEIDLRRSVDEVPPDYFYVKDEDGNYDFVSTSMLTLVQVDQNAGFDYLYDVITPDDGVYKLLVKYCDNGIDYRVHVGVDWAFSVCVRDRKLQLVNDESNPGPFKYYGTDYRGRLGWYNLPVQHSIKVSDDDQVPSFLNNKIYTTPVIEKEYDPNRDAIIFRIRHCKSISVNELGALQLVNDEDDPGPSMFYGVDPSGRKGWYTIPFNFFDEKVKVTADDSRADYLYNKLRPGDNVDINVSTDADGYQNLTIHLVNLQLGKVKTTVLDDPDFLQFKLITDDKIYFTTEMVDLIGSVLVLNYRRPYDVTEQDELIKVTINQQRAAYLSDVLVARRPLEFEQQFDSNIGIVYVLSAIAASSITYDNKGRLCLVNDVDYLEGDYIYMTDEKGEKRWIPFPFEIISMVKILSEDNKPSYLVDKLVSSDTVQVEELNDGAFEFLSLSVKTFGSITAQGALTLVNDMINPGPNRYYGTILSKKERGWYDFPDLNQVVVSCAGDDKPGYLSDKFKPSGPVNITVDHKLGLKVIKFDLSTDFTIDTSLGDLRLTGDLDNVPPNKYYGAIGGKLGWYDFPDYCKVILVEDDTPDYLMYKIDVETSAVSIDPDGDKLNINIDFDKRFFKVEDGMIKFDIEVDDGEGGDKDKREPYILYVTYSGKIKKIAMSQFSDSDKVSTVMNDKATYLREKIKTGGIIRSKISDSRIEVFSQLHYESIFDFGKNKAKVIIQNRVRCVAEEVVCS